MIPEFPGNQVSAQLVLGAEPLHLLLYPGLVSSPLPAPLSSGTLGKSSIALSTNTLMPHISVSQPEPGFRAA